MRNDESKRSKLPRHVITLIISLLVLLGLFLLVMLWYNHKISQIQREEQKLRKDISATSFNNNNHY